MRFNLSLIKHTSDKIMQGLSVLLDNYWYPSKKYGMKIKNK